MYLSNGGFLVLLFISVVSLMTSFCDGFDLRRASLFQRAMDKRKPDIGDGNPCPEAEKPFPCKATSTCIPMGYLCDDSQDCEDGYDEDPEVCTAAHRPPVEDIQNFLESTKSWILEKLFGGRELSRVAHGLVVSPTVEDFLKRLGMTSSEISNLRKALEAVRGGDEDEMASLGMPPSAWSEINFMFAKLIKSGFAA